MPERIEIPAAFLRSALCYRWSAQSQQLYFWLRAHVCRGRPGEPPETLEWHRRGFLVVFATGDRLRAEAVPVSKNTLTGLVEEMRIERVCIPRITRRGYIFLLGEWLVRPAQADEAGMDLYFETFYLDALIS